MSKDLKEYGNGYSTQNLYRMSQIANEYIRSELFSQPAREIPWYTLIEITHKSQTHKEMLWYIEQTHKNANSKTGVAKYKFIEELPEYLEKRVKENKDGVLNL